MALSSELIMRFVRATKDSTNVKAESTVYGTLVESDGKKYVRFDGSELLTPVKSTSDARDGDRVTVMIKNHTATVTGNLSSPSARTAEVQKLDTIVADKVSINELKATNANVENLKTNKLDAETAKVTYATIDELNATNAKIETLDADKLNADQAAITYATITQLRAMDAKIDNLAVGEFDAVYANIDFSNIGKAAMEYFYAQSGLIDNVVVGDQTITGELVGVTISGDRLIGNTVIAEKLVIKGSDGLYYKLNTDGMTVEAEQTDENSLNGQIIKAKSITATKISVDDLVAFDATIGGFNIGTSSLYSGVKSSVDNTTRGIYLDTDGQVAFGDASNFLKYYKDTDGNYKLEISAKSVLIGDGSTNLETTLEEIQNGVDNIEIGGRNLLTGTKDLSGFYSNTASTEYVVGSDGFTYADFPSVTTASYRAISSTYAMLPPDEVLNRQVVFSFELRSDSAWTASDTDLIVGFALCNSNSTTRLKYRTLYITDDIDTKWAKFEIKATLTEDFFTNGSGSFDDCTRFYVQIYNYSLNPLQIRKPKLEYGNKATDWTPAPEDMQTAIDAVKVGGRNLLRYTGDMPIVANYTDETGVGVYVTGAGTLMDTGEGIKLTYDSSGKGAIAVPLAYDGAVGNDETVTLSFDYKSTMSRTTYHYFLTRTSPNVTLHGFPALQISETEWVHYEHTFSHAEANARTCYSFMLAYNPGTDWAGTWVEIKKGSLKLERGNKVTDWSPAPEDVDSGIEEASKVAKNYMLYDSANGLQIGNKSSGSWSGFRTQITNAAFNVLNTAGTVLASYGAKLIELGKNATDAVISFCGGKGKIQYVADDDYIEMTGDNVRIRGDAMSSVYAYDDTVGKAAVNVTPELVELYATDTPDADPALDPTQWDLSKIHVGPRDINISAASYAYISGTDGMLIQTGINPLDITSSNSVRISGVDGVYIQDKLYGENRILWSGAYYMNGSQTITLKEAVSEQVSGIVLVFSYYENGAAKDHSFTTHFVPKKEVELFPGCGHTYLMSINAGFSAIGAKYLTFTDTTISGHAGNVSSGTNSGISFNNSNYVLRYVIGV